MQIGLCEIKLVLLVLFIQGFHELLAKLSLPNSPKHVTVDIIRAHNITTNTNSLSN